ncbi:MAG: hypothetical protein JRI97_04355 [Deltaproteobacteria bacterium]|nr:hypothetical protein [Deltaproteobacteria bacterium]
MTATNTAAKYRPREKTFRTAVVKAAFFAMGRVLESAAVLDEDVKREVDSWKDPFTFMFYVMPKGPAMVAQKKNGLLRYLGSEEIDADLVFYFKNMEAAFMICSGQIGTPQAYAEHRAALKGDASEALSVIRALNYVQMYLFPRFMAKKVLKRVPPMTPRKWLNRLAIFTVGLPLGLGRFKG